ncbi:MAG: ABC transporter permease subunit [bacterium]
MVSRIVKKELLLNLLGFRFQISFALLFILIVGSMQIMVINYGRRLNDYSTASEIHREDLAKVENIMQFEAFGITRDPKPTLLGIFAIGLEREMSRSFMIPGYAFSDRGMTRSVHASRLRGIELEASKYSNPIFTLFQPPDFIYVINIVLSLLAVLFAFDTISGEKETQTLKLMLTNAVPRDAVLIGKWLGGTISILMPFLIAFLAGILLTIAHPYVSLTSDAWWRILLLFGISALYIGVFFLLGMVFSVFTHNSATSLILSLFAWIFFVLVVPNVSPVIARQVVSIATPDQIIREEERIERDMREEIQELTPEEQEIRAKSLSDDLDEKVRELEDTYLRRLKRQVQAAMNVSRVSPSSTFIYATTSIAGTGINDYSTLKDKIIQNKYDLSEARKNFVKPDNTKAIPFIYINIDTEKVPSFEKPEQKLAESVNNSLIDIALLFIFAIIFFMVSFLKFLRYDVK